MDDKPRALESLDAQYPKEAFHDPETGMYRMPDPKPAKAADDYVETEGGVFIPRPAYKSVRIVNFDYQYHIEAVESAEQICADIDDAIKNETPWVVWHDPTFNTEVHIPLSSIKRVASIIEGFKDMDEVKTQIAAADAAKRMQRLQMQSQIAAQERTTMQELNRQARRNHR